MLQQVLLYRVRSLQSSDECECRDIFTTVENLGKLVMEVADVRLKAVVLSHFDGEEVVILLAFPAGAYWVRNASVISSKF